MSILLKLLLAFGVVALTVSAARAQFGPTPDTVGAILQGGGTLALITFGWWLIREERAKNLKYENGQLLLLERTLTAISNFTATVTESNRVLDRVASGVEKLTDEQRARDLIGDRR